jgi:hypothetical protein
MPDASPEFNTASAQLSAAGLNAADCDIPATLRAQQASAIRHQGRAVGTGTKALKATQL